MDRWMDVWIDGWMCGCIDGWMDGWLDREMYGWIIRQPLMLAEGFSASAPLTPGLYGSLMWGVLGTMGCGGTPLVSTHPVPGAPLPCS